ncbi:DUF2809 domain-containing protein [Kitasatospora camelliae]|uniref:DUF2809 domain-containing protein n=1 Tax=Kitasatospora camelliae TaxID=3156397 RepID=A0AAU8K029_9ACTN
MLTTRTRTRALAAAAAAATVAAGLGVRALAAGDLAKYAGDALYTVLVYALVVLAAPGLRPRAAAALALAVSWAVEFLQLTGVPTELSRHSTAARLVLGSTFNAPDLLCYALAAAGCLLLHRAAGPSGGPSGGRSGGPPQGSP